MVPRLTAGATEFRHTVDIWRVPPGKRYGAGSSVTSDTGQCRPLAAAELAAAALPTLPPFGPALLVKQSFLFGG